MAGKVYLRRLRHKRVAARFAAREKIAEAAENSSTMQGYRKELAEVRYKIVAVEDLHEKKEITYDECVAKIGRLEKIEDGILNDMQSLRQGAYNYVEGLGT